MTDPKTITEWMHIRNMDVDKLASSAGLDRKVVDAIVGQRYTSSPAQRERLAGALGLSAEQIVWGQAVPIDHMYGHGPQFGRSP